MSDEDVGTAVHRMLDRLYAEAREVPRSRIVQHVGLMSLPADLTEAFESIPPGAYTRRRLVDQVNAAVVARGISRRTGTFE